MVATRNRDRPLMPVSSILVADGHEAVLESVTELFHLLVRRAGVA
jgi:hypothetical protein